MQTPPTEDELAAILAAYEALQPATAPEPPTRAPRRSEWHFSGRWWMAPIPLRRARPYL